MPFYATNFPVSEKGVLTAPLITTLVSAWMGSLCMGASIGFTAPASESLSEDYFTTPEHSTWFASLLPIGAVVGCALSSLVAQAMGRRFALLVSALGYMGGYGIIMSANTVFTVLLGRFITGIATGMVSLCVPAYIAEISLPVQRGSMGGVLQFAITLGIMFTQVVSVYVDWNGLARTCLVLAIPFLALYQFNIESPRWLMLHGRRPEALDALAKLRGPAAKLEDECLLMETVFMQVPTPFSHLLLAMHVHFLQQFSGINAVIFYSKNLLDDAGLSLSGHESTIIFAAFQVVATAVAVRLMEPFSRKTLLTTSAYICVFSMMTIATLYSVNREDDDSDPYGKTSVSQQLPIVFVALYMIGFSVGLGPVTWILTAELVPLRQHGIYLCMVCAFNWTLVFLVTWFFRVVHEALELSGLGLFFSAVTFISALLVTFFMPETQDRSLEDILRMTAKDKDNVSVTSRWSAASRKS
ncbi:facilitated trehalose transporter Tret1-like isoform X1 [Haemaphysalis longicornis]